MRPKKPGFFRRVLHFFFNPKTFALYSVLTLIAALVFGYFYVKYSALIDARLRGDVLIRATGIFAAPKTIKVGQQITLTAIKSYLDAAGYVEQSKEADQKRGRYEIKGNALEIYSSGDAIINSVRKFPSITITFGQGGKGITKITDLETKRNYDLASLEPRMMTSFSNEKRQKQKLVSFKDLPRDYINAVLAIEDRQFFDHPGINVRGIFRAAWRDVGEGEVQQGGSSITQQLVKNFFLTSERTWKRKAQEIMIALVLETKLSKEEIFQLYTNDIYMGQSGNYALNGVGEAASTYFGKEVVNLTLPESAFLAGIIRGPSLYSPYRDLARAKARRNQVLDSMAETGLLATEKAEQAKNTDLKILPKRSAMNTGAPYFVDYLQQQIVDDFTGLDPAKQSYRVYTTIDIELQQAADKAVNDTLTGLDKLFSKRKKNPIPAGTLQAALVAMNPKTGEVLAMVGGRDYGQSQLNRAIEAHRQPGSVFKPIVYATALSTAFEDSSLEILTPASLIKDSPETFYYGNGQSYSPENYGKVYSNRDVSIRDALTHSLNVVTVRVGEKIGYSRVARMAEKLGLPRPQPYPSMALGTAEATPLEIAATYCAFDNGGGLVSPQPLRQIVNMQGVSLVEPQSYTKQILRPQVSWLITSILQDVINKGTGARARSMGFSAVAAGKTGTSRDGWFAGYTPNLVCVVWVGFDDNSELGLEGAKSALPIWTNFMKAALVIRPDLGGDSFLKPDGIVEVEIDPTTGKLATEKCTQKQKEFFASGTEPVDLCDGHEEDGETDPNFSWPEGRPEAEEPQTRPRTVQPRPE